MVLARTGSSCTWVFEARHGWMDSFSETASEFSGNNYCERFSLDGQMRLWVELEGFWPVLEVVLFLFWTGIKWTMTLLREVLYLKTFLQT